MFKVYIVADKIVQLSIIQTLMFEPCGHSFTRLSNPNFQTKEGDEIKRPTQLSYCVCNTIKVNLLGVSQRDYQILEEACSTKSTYKFVHKTTGGNFYANVKN